MDIFAHGFWSYGIYKYIKIKKDKKINPIFAAFWGIFPDFFAFSIPFGWLIWNVIFGNINFFQIKPEDQNFPVIFELPKKLYPLSHSLIVFLGVFLLIKLIKKKYNFEILAWALHILIDIPTHSRQFYPTPFLWPISNFVFDGISWGNKWFMIINYSLLLIFYLFLILKEKRFALNKKYFGGPEGN